MLFKCLYFVLVFSFVVRADPASKPAAESASGVIVENKEPQNEAEYIQSLIEQQNADLLEDSEEELVAQEQDELEKRGMPGVMRFGKRDMPGVMRFGKKAMPGVMRFGKRNMPGVMRFGKKDMPGVMRFGKRGMPGVMRFGKRDLQDKRQGPAPIRFG